MTATKSPPNFTISHPAPGVVQATLTHPNGTTVQQTLSLFQEVRIDPETGELEAILTEEARKLVLSAPEPGTPARLVADHILDAVISLSADHPGDETP